NGHALLGRPRERNHLRRAHVAAAPRGETPPARTRGGARRGGSSPLSTGGSSSPRPPPATGERLPERKVACFAASALDSRSAECPQVLSAGPARLGADRRVGIDDQAPPRVSPHRPA